MITGNSCDSRIPDNGQVICKGTSIADLSQTNNIL